MSGSGVVYATGTGCLMHKDCLTCPLERCIYDTDKVHAEIKLRRAEIRHMSEYLSNDDIAEQLDISVRTVQQVLKES